MFRIASENQHGSKGHMENAREKNPLTLLESIKLRNCDALRYLVPFAQFSKRKKHPLRSVTLSKVVGFCLQLY